MILVCLFDEKRKENLKTYQAISIAIYFMILFIALKAILGGI